MIYTHVIKVDWWVCIVLWTGFEAIEGGSYTDPHKLP
jgi:hypothetical protein